MDQLDTGVYKSNGTLVRVKMISLLVKKSFEELNWG